MVNGVDSDITPPERLVYQRAAGGQISDLADGGDIDVGGGASWGPLRTVRADKLRALVTGEVVGLSVHWRGVRIRGARIAGVLDLEAAVVPYPLELIDCWFDNPIRLIDAETRRILLNGSQIVGFDGAGARIRGELCLAHGFLSSGNVSLKGATVDGNLDCNGGRLLGAPESLSGRGLVVMGDVRLGLDHASAPMLGFAAAGEVCLVKATVRGDLDADGAQLGGKPEATSLCLDRAQIAGTVYLGATTAAGKTQSFTAAGGVSLIQAKVDGNLDCDGGHFKGRFKFASLLTSQAQIAGTVYLGVTELGGHAYRFTAAHQVRLNGATVGGDLDCRGGYFGGAGASLIADGAGVAGTVRLGVRRSAERTLAFVAADTVSLIQVRVDGELDCRGGEFRSMSDSLNADGAAVARSVRLGVIEAGGQAQPFAAAGVVRLIHASVGGSLICSGGQFRGVGPSLRADRVSVGGSVRLGVTDIAGRIYRFTAAGGVRLVDATVRGDLDCDGGHLEGTPESMRADGASVNGKVGLGVAEIAGEAWRFLAAGEVRLVDSTLGHDLDCDGGLFGGDSEATSLRMDGADIAGAAHLGVTDVAGQAHCFGAAGGVSLIQARVGGDLDCDGGRFGGRSSAASLQASRARVMGTVFLGVTAVAGQAHRFTAAGQVQLRDATIGGDLDCDGGHFGAIVKSSLNADMATVRGTLRLGVGQAASKIHAFAAMGNVSLIQSRVDGELDCRGGDLRGKPSSLEADGLKVARSVLFGAVQVAGSVCRLTAVGEVRMVGATVGGDWDCSGGEFRGQPRSLRGDRAEVQRSLRLSATEAPGSGCPFTSTGEVRLVGATVGGDLICRGGYFGEAHGRLDGKGMRVSGTIDLRTQGPPKGVCLRHARAGQLLDTESCWPPQDELDVDWFVYDGFTASAPRDAQKRLSWLGLQAGLPMQSYAQLASVYRNLGDDTSARKVGIAREWRRLRRGRLGPTGAAANVLLGATIGYGYRPGRALYFLIALYLFGAVAIYPHARNVMVATQPPARTAHLTASDPCPSNYPCYSPSAYSFDVLIPVIHLGQTDAWAPSGRRGDSVRYYGYFATVLGWALATIALVGFTGLVRRP
jgi:hypothetical protein